jgi:hypothetical protein
MNHVSTSVRCLEVERVLARSVFSGQKAVVDHPAVNFVGFYACWLACVLGGDEWILIPLGLITLHFVFVDNKQREISFSLAACFFGLLVDSALSVSGVFVFANDALMPLWLGVLWLAFSTTFNRGLAFLQGRVGLTFALAGVGGASSYVSGYYLGAVDFGYSTTNTLLILFAVWTFMLPFLLWLRSLLDRS